VTLRFVLETFGCQMNVHDSDRMAEVLEAEGWARADGAGDADLVIFNTCSVREKAEQKLRSEVGKLAPLKRARPGLVVAVAGCVAQQEGEKLLARVPHLDLVLGPDNVRELPALVREQLGGAPPRARTVFDVDAPEFLSAAQAGERRVTAYVTTMKGCDERCSFCVVPYTRGPERYRPAAQIVDEIRVWLERGAREVLLLGQTVDSYADPEVPDFPALLRLIAASFPRGSGLERLRYTSPHPRHATAELARAHAELDVLARHVHLPAQSGSDRVLRRMIRRYTRAEYVARARRLLEARSAKDGPGMTLSTDVIVGFPGETDADFEETLSLVREVGFVQLFGFKYSPRPNTPSLKLGDDVPEDVKSERLARLFEVVEAQGRAHLASLVGTTQTVLVADGRLGRVSGRTERNEIVHLSGPPGSLLGRVLRAPILAANHHSLEGAPPAEAARLPAQGLSAAKAAENLRLPLLT
jgi:tRNA-2-methylthio-N6-dimethylallyladenosine synthase